MSLDGLVNRPCTLVLRSESDERTELGNEVPDETLIETVWELQQKSRDEQPEEGEVSDTRWDAFFLPGTDLTTADAVIDGLTGHVFEVFGESWPVRNPTTQEESHIQATVRRTAGSEDAS